MSAENTVPRPEKPGQVLRKRIREAVESRPDLRDMSQKKLATFLGVSPTVLGMIENGEFPGEPEKKEHAKKYFGGKTESLIRICDALGLEVHDMLWVVGLDDDDAVIEKYRRKARPETGTGMLGKESIERITTVVDQLNVLNGDDLLLLGRLRNRFGELSQSELQMLLDVSEHISVMSEELIVKMIEENRREN